jgi:transcriptional regulator with XRE-family HTH domain
MSDFAARKRTLERKRELGEFIRAHRERLAPAAVGVGTATRRRTPGLRREEIAQLCGLSTTWYTWIEQGRDVSVSPSALARLAQVLQLGRAERTYLFDLAGKRDPDQAASDCDRISPAILKCVEMIAAPAYILDRSWNAVSWNKRAERLFAGWLDIQGRPNLLRFIFLEPAARTLICDWRDRARRVAAEFRASAGIRLNDSELRTLVSCLQKESAEFSRLWDQHEVLEREGGERTFSHPTEGLLRFEQVTFNVAGHPDLRLTILIEKDPPAGKAGKARRSRIDKRSPAKKVAIYEPKLSVHNAALTKSR